MAKDKTSAEEFQVAPRARAAASEATNQLETPRRDNFQEKEVLISSDPEVQRARSDERHLASQDGIHRLRSLRRQQAREAQRFINVPLEPELKRRLNRAATENEVKMAAIVRDAIRKYLEEAGY
ncbi:CopG family transcriptional regulator [Agrobacterium sp. LAD9]|uniref:ribbon-helix-helix domain-containing protein n=1 Tax=Agrobacterium sp. LAD9 TaxID=2055153 RepID=UPI000D1E2C5D|nr:CopG family transcriptional regulator [Agrobacterium sp. LAD9]